MPVSAEKMLNWCRCLISGDESTSSLSLQDYLTAVARLDSLGELPAGTPVLVRGDLDAKPGASIGQGDVRLRAIVDTLKFGQQRGWKQIIFGHIGRKPEGSLDKVAGRIGELLECDAPLIEDWLDEETTTIKPHVAERIAAADPGSLLVLQNTRSYHIERVLWKASQCDLPHLVDNLARLANQMAEQVAQVIWEFLAECFLRFRTRPLKKDTKLLACWIKAS